MNKFYHALPTDMQAEATMKDEDIYTDVGDLDANDLMQFAYQISTGMVCNSSSNNNSSNNNSSSGNSSSMRIVINSTWSANDELFRCMDLNYNYV